MAAITSIHSYSVPASSLTGDSGSSDVNEPTQSYLAAIIEMIVSLQGLQVNIAQTNAQEINISNKISEKTLDIVQANSESLKNTLPRQA